LNFLVHTLFYIDTLHVQLKIERVGLAVIDLILLAAYNLILGDGEIYNSWLDLLSVGFELKIYFF